MSGTTVPPRNIFGTIRQLPRGVLLVLLALLFFDPIGDTTASDGYAARAEAPIAILTLSGSSYKVPVFPLKVDYVEHRSACLTEALCLDSSTGSPGTDRNAVFYAPRSGEASGALPRLMDLKPGSVFKLVDQRGQSHEYRAIRSARLSPDDPALAGYTNATPGRVISVVQCDVALNDERVPACEPDGAEVSVLRAEAVEQPSAPETKQLGSPPKISWMDFSVELPGLLIGHLVFLAALSFFVVSSLLAFRRGSGRSARGALDVVAFLVGGWFLLGLALTEYGTKYTVNNALHTSESDWLLGGMAFLGAILFSSYLLQRLGLQSGRYLLRLAAVLTALGLIGIYYWEARTGSDGHPLFYTQLAASFIGLVLCPVLSFIVSKKKVGSALALPSFSVLASLALSALALGTVLAQMMFGRPEMHVPGGGSIILSPAIELLAVVCIISLLIAGGRRPERGKSRAALSLIAWSGPLAGIAALLLTDTGVGLVLMVACALTVLVAGVPIRRLVLVSAPLALLALVVLISYPEAIPARAADRVEAWLDPAGFSQRTERSNHVVRAFRRIVDHRLDEYFEPVVARDPQTKARPVAAQVAEDIDKVSLELSYRLHDLIIGDAEVAEGLVPEPGSGDAEILLIAEELWFGLGGNIAVEHASDVTSFSSQVQQAMVDLQDISSRLTALESSSAPRVSGSSKHELRAYYETVALLHADNYQQRRSLSALHSGRLIGAGWGLGSPERLPLATEDMAVALLGETLGFLGLASVVTATALIIHFGMTDCKAEGRYALATSGLSILLGMHAFVAIGGAIHLLPLSGIPLPFAGRGGASLVSAWIAIALLIGLRAHANEPSVLLRRFSVHMAPGRITLVAATLGLLAGIFLVAMTGGPFAPIALLGDASAPIQLPPRSLSGQGGEILDRDGRVLAQPTGDDDGARYPDRELAVSLSHTLTSLNARFSNELSASREHPVLTTLGGKFWGVRSPPSLLTTLDGDIQRTLHRAFAARLQSVDLDPQAAAAAVILDATTGEILASESRPTFDPGDSTDGPRWADNEAAARRSGIRGRLVNRTVSGGYPPGSTFKVVTLAAALESGLFTPDARVFDYTTADPAMKYHRLDFDDGPPVVDANHPHPGDWSFGVSDALVWSDNVAFAQIALTLGPEAIIEMARRFGFEQKIAVEGLGSSVSSVDSSSQGKTLDRFVRASQAGLAHTGYGQGEISVTPLQMAMVAAAVANDGVVMEPFVVDGWKAADENLVRRSPRPLLGGVVAQPVVLKQMQEILWSAVSDGWARDARVNFANQRPGVVGKTGTAEWSADGRSPHSWFIGYYPAEHPRIALAVLVEEAGGSHLASFIGRDVFASRAVNSYVASAFEKAGRSEWVATLLPTSASGAVETAFAPPGIAEIFAARNQPSAPLDPTRVRIIIATGDVIPARNVDAAIRGRNNDFLYPVASTAAVTSNADITLVNLEAPLIDGCPPHDSGLIFCGQKGFVQALTAAGVDLAGLENNHIGDYGAIGVLETKEALTEAGIDFVDRNVAVIRDVRGLRFGFLAFNGVGEKFDRQYIWTQLKTLRPQVDVLIVSFHWGAEYVRVPQPAPGVADDDPVEIAHLAVDAGADLIIGNHPHQVQAIEVYDGALITYAHGNFLFDQMWSYETRVSVIGRYTFYDDRLVAVDFLPTLIEDEAQPRLLEGAEAQVVLDRVRESSDVLATGRSDGDR